MYKSVEEMFEPIATCGFKEQTRALKPGKCHTDGCDNDAVMARGCSGFIMEQLCRECYDGQIRDERKKYTKSDDIAENIMMIVGEAMARHVFARAAWIATDGGTDDMERQLRHVADALEHGEMSLSDVSRVVMYKALPFVDLAITNSFENR